MEEKCQNDEEHDKALGKVLERIKESGLTVKKKTRV